MDPRRLVLKETAAAAAGVLICSCCMLAVFAVLGLFSMGVLLGALLGSALIIFHYFAMAVTVNMAADKAQNGDAASAQKMFQLSSVLRLILMGLFLFVGIKLGCNVVALVLPLAFLRPVLMVIEFFRKKGDT